MSIPVRSMRVQRRIQPTGVLEGRTGWGWLIQMALAIYLVPALLVVLLVGGIGMLVLAAARAITWMARGPEVGPRKPLDPGHPPHDPGCLPGPGPTGCPGWRRGLARPADGPHSGFFLRGATVSGLFSAVTACPGPPGVNCSSSCRTSSVSSSSQGPPLPFSVRMEMGCAIWILKMPG